MMRYIGCAFVVLAATAVPAAAQQIGPPYASCGIGKQQAPIVVRQARALTKPDCPLKEPAQGSKDKKPRHPARPVPPSKGRAVYIS